jgi:hypothetical protein
MTTAPGTLQKTSIVQRQAWLSSRGAAKQFELDTAMWYGCITSGNATPYKKELLRRLFLTFHLGGLFYSPQAAESPMKTVWRKWSNTSTPLAACLSHGGRVMIQLPELGRQGVPRTYWDWLWDQANPENDRRMAATHAVMMKEAGQMKDRVGYQVQKRSKLKPWKTKTKTVYQVTATYDALETWDVLNPNDPPQQRRYKYMNETKKGEGRHYGVNIGLGGVGNRNPFSGNIIEEDGRHGHLYICYVPPTHNRFGAVLVGCEGSAPIDRAAGGKAGAVLKIVGRGVADLATLGLAEGVNLAANKAAKHTSSFDRGVVFANMWIYDQTGGAHELGKSGKYSPTGGMKWTAKNSWAPDKDGPSSSLDAMCVDLITDPDAFPYWNHSGNDFDPDWLGLP